MKIKEKYRNISNERILELKGKIENKSITNVGFITSVFRTENLYLKWINSILEKKKGSSYNFVPANDFWGAKTAKIEQIYMMLQSNAIQNNKDIVCPSLECVALIVGSTVQWVAKVQKRLLKKGLIFFSKKAKNSLKYFSLKINQLKNLLSITEEKLQSATDEDKAKSFRNHFKQFVHSLNRFMKKSQIKNNDYMEIEYNFLDKNNRSIIKKQDFIDHPDLDL